MIQCPNANQSESILKRTFLTSRSGDGQHDGQVEEVDHLPVPQGGLEDHERAPDHILAGRVHTTNTTNSHISTIPETRVCIPTFYFSQMSTLSQVTVVPVYAVVHMLLAQPGQSLYFWLRG